MLQEFNLAREKSSSATTLLTDPMLPAEVRAVMLGLFCSKMECFHTAPEVLKQNFYVLSKPQLNDLSHKRETNIKLA